MAIVKMNKILAIGLDEVKASVVKDLMDLGVVEIDPQDRKLTQEDWAALVRKDGNEAEVAELEAEIARSGTAVRLLETYDKGKKPFIQTRKPVSWSEFDQVMAGEAEIRKEIDRITAIHDKMNEGRAEENKLETTIASLKPWLPYTMPLETAETKFVSILMGVVPAVAQLDQLRMDVEAKTARTVITVVGSDADQHYLSILCMKDEKEDVLDILRQFGFNTVTFKDMQGTAAENIGRMEDRIQAIQKERTQLEAQLSQMSGLRSKLEYYYDSILMKRDRAAVASRFVRTKRTFCFEGYLPAGAKDMVAKLLDKYNCYYQIEEIPEGEEAPVLLKETELAYPFEAITDMYALPTYREVDPTAWLAPFYFLFFGMMLSDAAYGIVITIACAVLLKKYRLEGMMRKLVKLFFWCGISTIFWGAMFGGWFGDFFYRAAEMFGAGDATVFGKPLSDLAIWFNPVNDPMTLLIFSFILGGVHLFLGMGIKAYMLIREGHWIDAVCDIGFWYLLLIGLVLYGVLGSTVGGGMAIVGALGLLLTGGRAKKGFFGKLVGGLGSLYGITSYLADVLSYSRLLALGLATGVIAQVINTMGSLVGDGVFGFIVLLIVGVVGHAFNISINALGSFVHSSRLQYVEFFGKFYEGGGTPFAPFNKKTKYVDIIREEK